MNIISYDNYFDICEHYLCDKVKLLELRKRYNIPNIIDNKILDYKDFNEPFYNKSLIFVFNYLIDNITLLKYKLSLFRNKFTIIFFDEDKGVEENISELLQISNLNKIFCRNSNFINSKIIPLPLGLSRPFFPHGDVTKLHEVMSMSIPKKKGVFFNFSIGTNPRHRQDCYDKVKTKGIKWIKDKPFEEYLKELASHRFCISPEGNGIDCHRTWEALYLRTIPICKRSILTEHFSKMFPIVLIDDWDILPSLNYRNYSWENYYKLDFEYWKKLILQ